MHLIIGQVFRLTNNSEFKDRETGVIKTTFEVQVLGEFREKAEIENIKVPSEFRAALEPFVGKNVVYAMKKWNKGADHGYSLLDSQNPVPMLLVDYLKSQFKAEIKA